MRNKSRPLDLFWWKPKMGGFNLGDELGRLVFERYFGMTVQHKNLAEAEAMSVGSILGWPVEKNPRSLRNRPLHMLGTILGLPVMKNLSAQRTRPLHVLGSGFIHGDPTDIAYNGMVYHFVRGALSYAKIHPDGRAPMRIGDMGLLCGDLVHRAHRQNHKYALVPHHSRVDAPEFRQFVERHPDSVIVDLRTDNLDAVCRQLSSARMVISQSLHGLVLADALGVANVWYGGTALHAGGVFKFLDYFSSVGRLPHLQVSKLDGPKLDLELERNAFELMPAARNRACQEIHLGIERFLKQRD